MAFDLIVFNRQVYLATTELVAQQINLFNEAARCGPPSCSTTPVGIHRTMC
ncbi:MAG: hypothetical protein LBB66_01280 [Desulfovibrio sp.]|jgi:hypothetical protein|nr:hypothetical protein [Desulfovibrio sp.]